MAEEIKKQAELDDEQLDEVNGGGTSTPPVKDPHCY